MAYLQFIKQFKQNYIGDKRALIDNCFLLHQANNSLNEDEWKKVYEGIKMNTRVAQQFARIGSNEILMSQKYFNMLPNSYNAIYQLTKFTDNELKDLFNKNKINSSTTRKQIDVMRRGEVKSLQSSKKENSGRFVNVRIDDISKINVKELNSFQSELNKLVKRYSNKIKLYVEDTGATKRYENRQQELLTLFERDLKTEKKKQSPNFKNVMQKYLKSISVFGDDFKKTANTIYKKYQK